MQVTNANHSPLLPDAVPSIRIFGPSGLVLTGKMPIVDKTVSPGLFCSRVFLGTPFTEGQHTAELAYLVAASPRVQTRNFDVIPAGNTLGQVVGMTYLHEPQADYILFGVESGRILRGKNPRVS